MQRKILSFRFFIALSLITLALAACSPADPPASVAQVTAFSKVCDKSNDGKNVAVVGYLRFPDSFTDSTSVVLRLYEVSGFSTQPIGVQTNFGTQANQMNTVSDQFKDTDLLVHLANGQSAQFGTKIKASGKVYFPLVDQEFDCGLENPYFELAP